MSHARRFLNGDSADIQREGDSKSEADINKIETKSSKKQDNSQSKIFYRPERNLRHWLGNWTRHLVSKSHGERSKIFGACRGVVKTDVDIAKFLLPYLVENVLHHGGNEDLQEIIQEILAVLTYKAIWIFKTSN